MTESRAARWIAAYRAGNVTNPSEMLQELIWEYERQTAFRQGVQAAMTGQAPTHNPYLFQLGKEALANEWEVGFAYVSQADVSGQERLTLRRRIVELEARARPRSTSGDDPRESAVSYQAQKEQGL